MRSSLIWHKRPLTPSGVRPGSRALGAADGVHLASAVSLEDGELVLASWDQALRRATSEVGLTVAPGAIQ